MSKQRSNHNKRHLFLNDNLSVCLAMEKGRCNDPRLLSVLRRISAHSVACGLKLRVRWIPSEGNPSDGASRWWPPLASKKGVSKPKANAKFKTNDEAKWGHFVSRSAAKSVAPRTSVDPPKAVVSDPHRIDVSKISFCGASVCEASKVSLPEHVTERNFSAPSVVSVGRDRPSYCSPRTWYCSSTKPPHGRG